MSQQRTTVLALLTALSLLVVGVAGSPARAATAPDLATAGTFAVLAASTVTNTGPSTISGDLGVSPGTAITGFGPGTVVGGTIHSADAVALAAQNDLTTAYNTAAGLPPTAQVTADLGGQSLVPGVYAGPTLSLTGALSLNAGGDPNAVFVFQAGSTLITASASSVVLLGGANPCNVFWQVGSSATLGTSSSFAGSVLALTSITAGTGATVQGRLLARNGAVTLASNAVTRPLCTAPSVTPTATPSTTAPATAAPSASASATPAPTSAAPSTTAPTSAAPSTAAPTGTSSPGPSTSAPAPGPGAPGTGGGGAAPTTAPPVVPQAPGASATLTAQPGVPVDLVEGPVVTPRTPYLPQLPRTGTSTTDLLRYALVLLALGLLAVWGGTTRRTLATTSR